MITTSVYRLNKLEQKIRTVLKNMCSHYNNIENTEIGRRFVLLSNYLGLSKGEGIEILNFILNEFMNSKKITCIEGNLRDLLKKKLSLQTINKKLDERAKKICLQIAQWILGVKLLDIGSGDGRVAKEIHKLLSKGIYLVDIVNYSIKDLPFILYDGENLPFGDNEFDTSLLLTTLHHVKTPDLLLKESLRVTKKRLIIIESIYDNDIERKANLFFDWLCNRIEKDINLPFNFKTPKEWKYIFNRYGARIIYEEDLGVDQPLVPEHHWLCVLNKGGRKI